ncbi:MAG: lysophospholipid acyltransferase family protein [Pyrinomonadaceae bacterium]
MYRFADLSDYSIKQRLKIRIADIIFYLAIRVTGWLTRFEVEGMEHFDAISASGHVPIFVFWHDRIFLSTYFWRERGIAVMTSKSFDGEYIARFIQRFGYGAIRGSSSRGGSRALVEMIKEMRAGMPMAFTIDGPRGPRYEAKPGPVILAKKTGNPILPFVVECKSFWNVGSWDRMHIPKPFTKARVIIGEPIYAAADNDAEEMLKSLQASLDDLVERGKQWSGRID